MTVYKIFFGYCEHDKGCLLRVWLVMWKLWVQAPSKARDVSVSKKLYPYGLALVGSRNGFKGDFTIKLK